MVLSACLMGNHLHVLVEDVDPVTEAAWLARSLRRAATWCDLDVDATVAADRTKVRRDIRYISLNPCRARLVPDPLEWTWSTHRELFGAVTDPWVDVDAIRRLDGSVDRHHAYVSADPFVSVDGTPPPRAAVDSRFARVPLVHVAEAARSATRGGQIRRQGPARWLFLKLARAQGWTSAAELAEICGISRQSVHRAWGMDLDMTSARICLADPRLRRLVLPSDPNVTRHHV